MTSPGVPGFASPYAAPPVGTLLTPPPSTPRRRPLGALALVLAILAGVVASGIAGFASFRIARGAGAEFIARGGQSVDWRLLSPVRDFVLLGEVAFWSGTALGIAALAVGIVATVRNTGRGPGIAAIVIAALGPFLFAGLVFVALAAGAGELAGAAV
ncbi:MAG: hypothetical protein BGO45_11775 [Microbacterium sp. 71-36]|uniref:hypothetical protein n=1 Tax=unclassified Microbacterium TaxID=2609290 RepID=UPI00086EDCA8|nr:MULTISPECIES: hypothetical protein [unclassified Microbacterium]MBN9210823.1 hypothetical protein [Microbacterium sp.]ODT42145.1 MAG: hypothetical protein ABS60_01430 [Microbacterium sp. SCN 71-17]OJV77437.1 MAG: hypothetical protein BGO45_11775 [Microbacterium sp. 71-36]